MRLPGDEQNRNVLFLFYYSSFLLSRRIQRFIALGRRYLDFWKPTGEGDDIDATTFTDGRIVGWANNQRFGFGQ